MAQIRNEDTGKREFPKGSREGLAAAENSHDDPSTSRSSRTGLFKVSSGKFDESIERYYSAHPTHPLPVVLLPRSLIIQSESITHPRSVPVALRRPPSPAERRPPSVPRPLAAERRYQRRPFPVVRLRSRS